jgi:hypothetical protein
MVESRYEIAANGQYLRVYVLKFANTRLVCGEFLCSTTRKCGWEEGQDDVLLTAKIGKLHGMIVGVGQREIRGGVACLQLRVLLRLLRKKRRRNQRESNERKGFHSNLGASLSQFKGIQRVDYAVDYAGKRPDHRIAPFERYQLDQNAHTR